MKRSKHFRKDVILARVIFAILCIVIIVLIWMGVSALMDKVKEDESQETESQQTEIYDIPQFEDTEDVTEPEDVADEVAYYAKTTASVRMRKEPNTNCEVLITVPAGTKTDIVEEVDGWYKFSYNGLEGYIRADYIEVVEEIVSPDVTEE